EPAAAVQAAEAEIRALRPIEEVDLAGEGWRGAGVETRPAAAGGAREDRDVDRPERDGRRSRAGNRGRGGGARAAGRGRRGGRGGRRIARRRVRSDGGHGEGGGALRGGLGHAVDAIHQRLERRDRGG